MTKKFHPQGFLLALTGFAAVAGFLLRSAQLAKELLSDGSLAAGAKLHIVLGALTFVLLAGLIGLLFPLEKKTSYRELFSPAAAPNLLQILCSVGLIAGNLVLWSGGNTSVGAVPLPVISRVLSALLPPLGLLSALCVAAFAMLRLCGKKPSALLYMIASIYLVVRLFVRFQSWNTDPSIYDYGFQLLAAICCMLGMFQLGGFCFDRGKRRITLFWTLLATVFCAITVADTVHTGALDEGLINASLLLFMAVSSGQLLFAAPDGTQAEKPA